MNGAEEVNEPFLPKDNGSSSIGIENESSYNESKYDNTSPKTTDFIDGHDAKYTLEYRGETIFIDTDDWRHSRLLKGQIVCGVLLFALFGLQDQTVGTLIPVLQEYYEINDVQTGFLFLASVCGYITMGLLNGPIHNRIGFRGILFVGTFSMTLAYSVFSFAPPYWVIVLFACCSGIGCGVLDAAFNSWSGQLKDSNQILGFLHGSFGLGCMISPTFITYLLEREKNPWKWYYYYRLLAGLGLICFILTLILFRYETANKYKYVYGLKMGQQKQSGGDIELSDVGSQNGDNNDNTEEEFDSFSIVETLKSKLVWTFTMILFIYVGGEVAFGSWLISYLVRISKLDYTLASHVATSFWLGLTIGRIGLGFVTASYFSNELNANMAYIVGSVLGYFLFYLVSFTSWYFLYFIIALAAGILVGPIFQTTVVASIKVLPPRYHNGVGFLCSCGGGGGAATVPFLVGVIADSGPTGLRFFPIVIIILYCILAVMWFVILKKFTPTYNM